MDNWKPTDDLEAYDEAMRMGRMNADELRRKIEELIKVWRQDAKSWNGYSASEALMLNTCADELEEVLNSVNPSNAGNKDDC